MRPSIFFLTAWLALTSVVVARAEDPAVAGWTERIRLLPSDLELAAKLDSGAENSSLHVEKQRLFRRGDKRWVRFTVEGDDGRRVALERPLIRKAAIRRHSGKSDVRPVVAIKVCLGSTVREVEVNLVDRSGFGYPILIGRSFVEGEFLIDVSRQDIVPLACEEASD